MENLIIVESPTKARTIKSFLGKEYEVVASKGHIMDLPSYKMGVKVENRRFYPEYIVDKEHKDVVKLLQQKAALAKKIYIATDEDREGEAIGYFVAKAIKKEPTSLPRIVFHEITKRAIKESLKNPRTIDMSKVNAQQARRILDRIVGYNLSPLLSQKIQKGLSAGRVQSSALKIVVDREKEIQNFKPKEFWNITAYFEHSLEAKIVEFEKKKIDRLDIKNKQEADLILNMVQK